MIELKHVHKTYQSKKSKNTKALNDVSLTLSEKGMTFILGKSGSGKSTLLNVLGGLDKYDSGDMLILGKSSKDFTQADFDSYRNTYVGFIFQEFNILEDYDVYQNIVLALQLQQKEANEKEIDHLLSRLELTDLKKRKVNELSGGQKQRVAIARALIKDPKIILADEPTGNLDSKTGRQVMDLLKEISKEKLVVIVSHDEEYAKTYGDRIIEIKDGTIVKDSKEEKKKSETKNTYQTIKSKLPFWESLKLGIGSLKHKKIKLGFTILLTVLTLGFLSCTDTLSSHNFAAGHAKLLNDQKEQFIQIEKKHVFKEEDGYTLTQVLPMDQDSIQKIEKQIKGDHYDVYHYQDEQMSNNLINLLHIQNNNMYDENEAELVVTSDVSNIIQESITGRNAKEKNEIVISNDLANLIIEKGIEVHEKVIQNEFKESNIFEPKTYEDILNTNFTYYFGARESVKIVGIINYDLSDVSRNYKNNVLNKIFVAPSFIKELEDQKLNSLKSYYQTKTIVEGLTQPNQEDDSYTYMGSYSSPAVLDHEIEFFDGDSWRSTNTLGEKEAILSIDQVANGENYYDDLNNYVNRGYEDYETLNKRFLANYIKEKNIIGKKVELKLYYNESFDDLAQSYSDLTVVGVYYRDNYCEDEEYCFTGNYNYFSSALLDSQTQRKLEKSSILYPMTEKESFKKATEQFPPETELAIKSTYSEQLYMEKKMLDAIQKVAFYASLIFLAFTVFLIINFMFNSISYRKKEIGILRALGSRGRDVMKIFLWEGVGLSLISGTIASILLVIVSNAMNSFIMRETGLLTTPFLVGIRQFVVIYLLVFAITMISSILPILRISRMKPIDAILNK